MKYAIHGSILFVWFAATRYAMVCLEEYGYDIGLVAILFLCGVIACAQLFILLTEAEELVTKG